MQANVKRERDWLFIYIKYNSNHQRWKSNSIPSTVLTLPATGGKCIYVALCICNSICFFYYRVQFWRNGFWVPDGVLFAGAEYLVFVCFKANIWRENLRTGCWGNQQVGVALQGSLMFSGYLFPVELLSCLSLKEKALKLKISNIVIIIVGKINSRNKQNFRLFRKRVYLQKGLSCIWLLYNNSTKTLVACAA